MKCAGEGGEWLRGAGEGGEWRKGATPEKLNLRDKVFLHSAVADRESSGARREADKGGVPTPSPDPRDLHRAHMHTAHTHTHTQHSACPRDQPPVRHAGRGCVSFPRFSSPTHPMHCVHQAFTTWCQVHISVSRARAHTRPAGTHPVHSPTAHPLRLQRTVQSRRRWPRLHLQRLTLETPGTLHGSTETR